MGTPDIHRRNGKICNLAKKMIFSTTLERTFVLDFTGSLNSELPEPVIGCFTAQFITGNYWRFITDMCVDYVGNDSLPSLSFDENSQYIGII